MYIPVVTATDIPPVFFARLISSGVSPIITGILDLFLFNNTSLCVFLYKNNYRAKYEKDSFIINSFLRL